MNCPNCGMPEDIGEQADFVRYMTCGSTITKVKDSPFRKDWYSAPCREIAKLKGECDANHRKSISWMQAHERVCDDMCALRKRVEELEGSIKIHRTVVECHDKAWPMTWDKTLWEALGGAGGSNGKG